MLLAALVLVTQAAAQQPPAASAPPASPAAAAPAPEADPGQAITRDLQAGGVVFVPAPDIELEKRELKIGRDSFESTYVLSNTGTEPRSFLGTFALPEIDMPGLGDTQITLPSGDDRNYVAATVSIDGQVIEPTIEQRVYAFGLDVSQLLADTGLQFFPFAEGLAENLSQLPTEIRDDFVQRGIVRLEEDRVDPFWTVRTTMYWLNTVPAGKTITVTLAYQPIAGSAPYAADDLERLREAYCIEKAVEDTVKRKAAQRPVSMTWHTYSLSNDAHQSGPAKSFRLVLQKPDSETIVATCRKGMKVLGPTAWEWTETDYAPEDDLGFLFIR